MNRYAQIDNGVVTGVLHSSTTMPEPVPELNRTFVDVTKTPAVEEGHILISAAGQQPVFRAPDVKPVPVKGLTTDEKIDELLRRTEKQTTRV